MKRVIILVLLAALLLCGCGSKGLTLDTDAQTISDGKYTYQYEDELVSNALGDIRTITITYPNGGKYIWRNSHTDSMDRTHYDYTDDYDEVTYAEGERLVTFLMNPESEAEKNEVSVALIVAGAGFVVLGVLNVMFPRAFFQITEGWRYENLEPSENGLLVRGIGGAITAIGGIVLIIIGL